MVNVNQKRIGTHYETTALEYLQRCGLVLIERNFHARFGEIDLIMKDKETFVFVEVKYRKNQHHGHAAEMVTSTKMAKMVKTANWWMMTKGLSSHETSFRFDVVAIHQNGTHVDWIKNAITRG